MKKEQIIQHYNSLPHSKKKALTERARAWMRAQGVDVSPVAFFHWRNRPEGGRGPLEGLYLRAYTNAITNNN